MKGQGTTRKSTSRSPKGLTGGGKTAGKFGFSVLGKVEGVMSTWGFGVHYSKSLSQQEALKEAQRYLDTGTWDRYYKKAAPDIAKQIAEDINVRGANIYSDRQYLVTADGSNARILITQDKNYKWVAKLSSASDPYKGSSLAQIGDIISESLRKKK